MPVKKQKKTPPGAILRKNEKNVSAAPTAVTEDIFELIKFLDSEKVDAFEYSKADFSVSIKRASRVAKRENVMDPELLSGLLNASHSRAEKAAPAGKAGEAPSGAGAASALPPPAEDPGLKFVETPITGTFYRSPSPASAPYVSENQKVRKGQVVCIVEAMKLMNEIKSEFDGTVQKIMVDNGATVQAKQKMFAILPD